jgi:hypothetical protein
MKGSCAPNNAHRPISTSTHLRPALPSERPIRMNAPMTYTREKMRKACCEMASRSFSGDNGGSDALEDSTTVTAPMMASAIPNKSR